MSHLLVPSSLISSQAISRVGDRGPLWYPKQNRKKEKYGATGVFFSEAHHTVVNRKIIPFPLWSLLAGHKMSEWYKQFWFYGLVSACWERSKWPTLWRKRIHLHSIWMDAQAHLPRNCCIWLTVIPPRVWRCIFPNEVDLHSCSVISLPTCSFSFWIPVPALVGSYESVLPTPVKLLSSLVLFQDKCKSHRGLENCPGRQLSNRSSINFSGCCQGLVQPSLAGTLAGLLSRH